MYVERIPNRNSPPAVLLREAWREDGRIRKRTIANLSAWSDEKIEALRRVLRDEPVGGSKDRVQFQALQTFQHAGDFEITRSLPHGHVAAVLGTIRKLGLSPVLDASPSPQRDLVIAMLAGRIIEPRSKLATARGLDPETASSSLTETLGLGSAGADDLYEAMDWLLLRQGRIEQQLAKRHLSNGTLVLYDVSSTYFEGRCCPLARLGHSRDERSGNLQIVFGVLTNGEGCPVAVEVFEGNTADPKTVAAQVEKLRVRFDLKNLVLVGDRGMLTQARIREELKPVEGLDWITALRSPQIKALVGTGSLQLSLFDQRDLAEITHPDYPGERLIACRNPLLAVERARKREELLAATEKELTRVQRAVARSRNPLRGKDNIGLTLGKVINRYKMAKHFSLTIHDAAFDFQRKTAAIDAEALLDGLYVIRTSLKSERASAEQTVGHYKSLSSVERAFRSMKSVDLKVRPIFHYLADRVRAHVFLCMLAYYVEWHMRRALAPMLFDDDDPAAARSRRKSIVAPAQRSQRALDKAHSQIAQDGLPVHSFQTLLADLATISKNTIAVPNLTSTVQIFTTPTPVQQRALDLLGVPIMPRTQ